MKKKTAPKKTAKKGSRILKEVGEGVKALKPFLKKKVAKSPSKAKERLNALYKIAKGEDAPTDFEFKNIVEPAPVPAVRELPEEDSSVSVILSMKDVAKEADYELEAFTPVQEDSSDKDTTVSDLALLNNQLALCNAALPHVHSIQTLCTLSTTVQNLIRTRRGVKKLEYGSPTKGNVGRVFEVIE